jgi:hypothetical protein
LLGIGGKGPLVEKEREYFRRILFENERFLRFLSLFMPAGTPQSHEELVEKGMEVPLNEESIRPRTIQLFGYYDMREFSKGGVFASWGRQTEVIERNLSNDTYYPVSSRPIAQDVFLNELVEGYELCLDRFTRRAPVYCTRDKVCVRLRIPFRLFNDTLFDMYSSAPHLISLERTPRAAAKRNEYGILRREGLYYFLKIREKEQLVTWIEGENRASQS